MPASQDFSSSSSFRHTQGPPPKRIALGTLHCVLSDLTGSGGSTRPPNYARRRLGMVLCTLIREVSCHPLQGPASQPRCQRLSRCNAWVRTALRQKTGWRRPSRSRRKHWLHRKSSDHGLIVQAGNRASNTTRSLAVLSSVLRAFSHFHFHFPQF
jgi:hypothetical protein